MGKVHLTDQPLVDAINAGAVNLPMANSSHIPEVIQAIEEAAATGLTGLELRQMVQQQFSFEPGQEPPRNVGTPALWAAYDERLKQEGIVGGVRRTPEA